DAGAVHVLERLLDGPGERRGLQQRAHLLDEFRRRNVMVGVDAMGLRRGRAAGAALRPGHWSRAGISREQGTARSATPAIWSERSPLRWQRGRSDAAGAAAKAQPTRLLLH